MNRKVIPSPTTDKVDKKLTPGIRIAIVEKIKQQLIIKRKSINLVYLNKLIDYSMVFPFYQGLNPLLNGKSNKDAPLSSGRSILARGSRGPGPGPWAPARQNASTN